MHYYGVAGAKGPNPYLTGTPNYAHVGNTTTAHGGNAQNGMLCVNRNFGFRDATDGTSNTFMVGEISNRTDPLETISWRPWTQGASGYSGGTASYACKNILNPIGYSGYNTNVLFNDVRFGSQHVGGTHFLFGDGAVRFVSGNIDFATYKAVASRDGQEPVTID